MQVAVAPYVTLDESWTPMLDHATAPIAPTARPVRAGVEAGARLASIDVVRGMVIALMVLDHARDYFSASPFSATDLTRTTPALFSTRWITHLCAPTFVFLAGVSAFMSGGSRSSSTLRRYLFVRGAWLVLLELTVVHFAWHFNLGYQNGVVLQVIWVIGVSMCTLAALVSVPRPWLAVSSLSVIALHNLLDGVAPAQWGAWAPLWSVLHVQGMTPFAFVVYPLVPWLAVMALGFVAGELYTRPSEERRAWLLRLGTSSLIAFVALRTLNTYGDPKPWAVQERTGFTLLSFLNVSKYPPSLAYVLVTLGIALLALGALEGRQHRVLAALAIFGRVPLFAYVLHIAIVHAAAGLCAWAMGFGSAVLTGGFEDFPEGWGVSLPLVYVAWLFTLALLWPACRWFARLKQRRRDWWLAYL